MKRDILVTVFGQAFSLVASFVLISILADSYGEYGVGFFSIIRRVAVAYTPLVLLGGSIAISRELLKAQSEDLGHYASLIFGSMVVMTLNLILAGLIFFLLEDVVYKAIVGEEAVIAVTSHAVMLLVFLWLFSSSVYTYAYAFFRGKLRFVTAAVLRTAWAIVPLVVVLVGGRLSIEQYLSTVVGIYVAAVVLVLGYILVTTLKLGRLSFSGTVAGIRYVLSFGLPRLPLFFVASWILTGGIYLLGLVGGFGDGARYSLSLSLLRYAAAAVSAVGVVLLPRMRASDRTSNQQRSRMLLTFIFDVSVPLLAGAVVVFPWFMDTFLNMSQSYSGSLGVKLLFLLGAPGIMAYELLRNVLDAVAFRAYNTLHSVISLASGTAVFAALYWLLDQSAVDAVNMATGFLYLVLGLLTVWKVSALLEIDFKSRLGFPIVQGLVALVLWALHVNEVILLATLLIVFAAGLVYLRRPWVMAFVPLRR